MGAQRVHAAPWLCIRARAALAHAGTCTPLSRRAHASHPTAHAVAALLAALYCSCTHVKCSFYVSCLRASVVGQQGCGDTGCRAGRPAHVHDQSSHSYSPLLGPGAQCHAWTHQHAGHSACAGGHACWPLHTVAMCITASSSTAATPAHELQMAWRPPSAASQLLPSSLPAAAASSPHSTHTRPGSAVLGQGQSNRNDALQQP